MGNTRFLTHFFALIAAVFTLAQCDFNIFPDFLTRVTYTKNLGDRISPDAASCSLAVVNDEDSREYVLIVQYFPTGNRKLIVLDSSLNVLLETESAGFGKAAGFVRCTDSVTAATRYALVCGVVLINKDDITNPVSLTVVPAPTDTNQRDYFLHANGSELRYFTDNGGSANLTMYFGTVSCASGVWTFPTTLTVSTISIGSTAGRVFSLEALKPDGAYMTAVFRENTGTAFLVHYDVSLIVPGISDAALFSVPGNLCPNGSWIPRQNQVFLLMADGNTPRYRQETGVWMEDGRDDSGGWQYRNYCIDYGTSLMYAFDPRTRELFRVRPEWESSEDY